MSGVSGATEPREPPGVFFAERLTACEAPVAGEVAQRPYPAPIDESAYLDSSR